MNTNKIKSFAQAARNILLPNINQRLRFWGFDEKGNFENELIPVQGGYIFREQIYSDTSVPVKLERLASKINSPQSFKDIQEEAAYTWFNRMMAIKILEKNGFETTVLAFAQDNRTPLLLQNAKRGSYDFVAENSRQLLLSYLEQNKDEEAFALLLTHYCNQHDMLRTIFGKINDYTEILTPMNLLAANGLMQLLNDEAAINDEDYKEVELIGWLYQFYISDKKDEVFANFKKKKKARPQDIPAATQIFTPKWIVKYMVENTLGKLYLDYEPDADDFRDELQYLIDNTDSHNALIDDIADLRILDPACGSGHILVVAFDLLMKVYDEAGYNKRQAAKAILTKHLYGLDIDDRAAQLANFAVRLKAAQYDKQLLTTTDLIPIVAFPEAMPFDAEDVAFIVGETAKNLTFKIENALEILQQGKNLGAVIQIELSNTEREQLHTQWQTQQLAYQQQTLSYTDNLRYERLNPFLSVLLILTDRFPAVVANPPYMGNRSMNKELKEYLEKNYPISKSDLFAVFIERMKAFACKNGLVGNVTMESWMFLSSYEKLRNRLLSEITFTSLSHFGWHVMGIAFGTVAFTYKNKVYSDEVATYNYLAIDDINKETQAPFEFPLRKRRFAQIPQINFDKIPGSPIAYWVSEREQNEYYQGDLLGRYTEPKTGINTGENSVFLRLWFEVNSKLSSFFGGDKWFPYNKGGVFRRWYGNKENVIDWENDGIKLKERSEWKTKKPTFRNRDYWFEEGFTWTTVSGGGFSARFTSKGAMFDSGGSTLFGNEWLTYSGGLINSKVANRYLEFLAPTLNFQPGNIAKILFIKPNNKTKSDIEFYTRDNIHLSKTDWDSRETSWDFEQSPLVAAQGEDLAAAYDKWTAQVTADFYQLHENEEELNRIFIDIYGLQAELTPDVPLKDITILQEELDRKALDGLQKGDALPIDKGEVVRQFISYCVGCAMGRYHLGKNGLHIAHPKATTEETAPYVFTNVAGTSQTFEMDEDGILPMMGYDSPFADELVKFVTRIVEQLWGKEHIVANLNFINEALDMTLEDYINHPIKGFWKHHTQMYKKRPIYWLFSSSQKGQSAFQVVAYLHRMDKYTIQKIRTRYLHPYQAYLIDTLDRAQNDASVSPKRLDQLEAAILECRTYDETLKPLEDLQLELDLDDGVVENYKLFGKAVRKV